MVQLGEATYKSLGNRVTHTAMTSHELPERQTTMEGTGSERATLQPYLDPDSHLSIYGDYLYLKSHTGLFLSLSTFQVVNT